MVSLIFMKGNFFFLYKVISGNPCAIIFFLFISCPTSRNYKKYGSDKRGPGGPSETKASIEINALQRFFESGCMHGYGSCRSSGW